MITAGVESTASDIFAIMLQAKRKRYQNTLSSKFDTKKGRHKDAPKGCLANRIRRL